MSEDKTNIRVRIDTSQWSSEGLAPGKDTTDTVRRHEAIFQRGSADAARRERNSLFTVRINHPRWPKRLSGSTPLRQLRKKS